MGRHTKQQHSPSTDKYQIHHPATSWSSRTGTLPMTLPGGGNTRAISSHITTMLHRRPWTIFWLQLACRHNDQHNTLDIID